MADLEERFRSLGRTAAPDLWEEVQARPPGPLPPAPRRGRFVAGITALAVAVAGFAVAVTAFDDRTATPPTDESPAPPTVANGAVAAAVGADQDIVLIDPITGESSTLVERHRGGNEGGLAMAWSPDGSKLAFTDYRANDAIRLFILDLASGDVLDLSEGITNADSPAWSPDGTEIAFTGCGCESGYEIYVVGVDGNGRRRVTDWPDDGVSGAHFPAWSPDGTRIAFSFALYDEAAESESSGIAYVDLETDAVTTVTETHEVDESPAWSPDGTTIAFMRKVTGVEEVLVANADGSGVRSIVRDVVDPIPMSPPSWSPNGSQVLFGAAVDDWGIWLANADGTNARPILEDAYAGGPVWAPDGTLIAFVGDDAGHPLPRVAIKVIRPDGSDLRGLATVQGVSELAWQPWVIAAEPAPVTSSNGPILFQHVGDDGWELAPGPIESVEPDGSNRRVVFSDDPMRVSQLAWSPDGSRMAYVNPVHGERGVYVANADGSDPVRLTDGPNDGHPSWSPDGSRIVFSSTVYDPSIGSCAGQQGQEFLCATDVYAMDADGSNVVRLTSEPAAEFQPAWSPDGTRIAFVRVVRGETPDEIFVAPAIFTMATDGSDARQVSQTMGEWGGSDLSPTWSPDGTRIAFVGFRWEDFGLLVVDADGSNEVRIDGNGFAFAPWWRNTPAWSPDGSRIAFVCLPDEDAAARSLCLVRPDGTGLERIADVPWSVGDIAWRPVPTAAEPIASPSPPNATVGETIEVGQSSAVLAAAGSVWVASFEVEPEYRQYVLRIDERSGEVLVDIPVDAIPDSEVGGAGMVYDGRFVWIVGTSFARGEPDRGVLVRIDPETNTAETFDLGVGAAGPSQSFDGQSLWTTGAVSRGNAPRILQVDPASGAVLAEIPFDAEWWGSLVVVAGAIWISEMTVEDSTVQGDPTLVRIDPITGDELARTSLGSVYGLSATTGPVGSVGAMWGVGSDELLRLDLQTGQVLDRMPAEVGFDLELGPDGSIWYLDRWESLNRLDPATGDTDVTVRLERGVDPIAIAVTEIAVWVLNYQGTLTRVALS